jgi:cyclase
MVRIRIIPVLLLSGQKLVKTINFKNRIYVGDPINTIKIFNEKQVDELLILDIDATRKCTEPNYEYIEKLTSQCFMPLAYGGGISNPSQAKRLLSLGVEKIIINTAAIENPIFISELADEIGSQSVVVSLDFKKNWLGSYKIKISGGQRSAKVDPFQFIEKIVLYGAGEIIINSIDHDGTQNGYDLNLIKNISKKINVPLISCGGAGNLTDLASAIKSGASAVAAGSMFLFSGPHKAVLINFPKYEDFQNELNFKI